MLSRYRRGKAETGDERAVRALSRSPSRVGEGGDRGWRLESKASRKILAEFDEDCRRLPAPGRNVLRSELATQIELEALRFLDADKLAVLTLALKHFGARE